MLISKRTGMQDGLPVSTLPRLRYIGFFTDIIRLCYHKVVLQGGNKWNNQSSRRPPSLPVVIKIRADKEPSKEQHPHQMCVVGLGCRQGYRRYCEYVCIVPALARSAVVIFLINYYYCNVGAAATATVYFIFVL